jgi:hypothetical protein
VSTKPRSIEVENLDLNWGTRLHMAVLQVLDERKAFRSSFRRPESIPNPPSDTQSAPNTWNVWFKGQSTICAALSSRHSMELKAPESLKLVISGGNFELSVPQCAFFLTVILEAKGLVWTLADQSNDQIAQERFTFDYIVSHYITLQPVNRSWLTCSNGRNCCARSGPVYRWGRKLKRTNDCTVICTSLARFSLQLYDDPFEVTVNKKSENFHQIQINFKNSNDR